MTCVGDGFQLVNKNPYIKNELCTPMWHESIPHNHTSDTSSVIVTVNSQRFVRPLCTKRPSECKKVNRNYSEQQVTILCGRNAAGGLLFGGWDHPSSRQWLCTDIVYIYICYWIIQFLNNVIIIKMYTLVPLETIADIGYPVYVLWTIADFGYLVYAFMPFGFFAHKDFYYLAFQF